MKDFVQQFVAEPEQLPFVRYYEEFSKMFVKETVAQQEAWRAALYQKAMAYLNAHDAVTSDFIAGRIKRLRSAPGDHTKELENIERFLTRCGVYADFVELKGKSAEFKVVRAFADDAFTDFVRRIVAPHDHVGFTRYYEVLSEKLNSCDEHKRLVTYKYLFSKALSDLETKHADWYAVLMHYGVPDFRAAQEDMVAAKARMFLRRYGAYQEYLEVTGQLNNGFFASLGSFCSTIGKTISGWFGVSAV